jgi:hypothetical protein
VRWVVRLYAPHEPGDDGHDEQHQEDKEQTLGYRSGRTGDAAKSKDACNQGYDEKYQSIVQHRDLLCLLLARITEA